MNKELEITVEELQALQKKQDVFILDVREPEEYAAYNCGGYLIPLGELPDRLDEIDTSKPIVVHCKLGGRSQRAVEFLIASGIPARNLLGGIEAWLKSSNHSASPLVGEG